ncbi:hypothetical protein QCD71_10595 [Sphingomonas sp. PsM26]|jgi:hypothetical protein|nr:hypothetical protein [Sphingomonas sp. PsM26]
MLTEIERSQARFQIYEIDLPGAPYRQTVVAHCMARALEISLNKGDDIESGQMLLVWNVTNQWILHSRMAAEATFSLLGEKREGQIEFDYKEGWQRVPDAE